MFNCFTNSTSLVEFPSKKREVEGVLKDIEERVDSNISGLI